MDHQARVWFSGVINRNRNGSLAQASASAGDRMERPVRSWTSSPEPDLSRTWYLTVLLIKGKIDPCPFKAIVLIIMTVDHDRQERDGYQDNGKGRDRDFDWFVFDLVIGHDLSRFHSRSRCYKGLTISGRLGGSTSERVLQKFLKSTVKLLCDW